MSAAHVICALLPLRIVSTANLREHWTARGRRSATHRHTARLALRQHQVPNSGPLTITLTRIAPRNLDSDNLAISFKAVRDGVADFLGVDDGHKSLTWLYDQRKGKPGQYAAEVTIAWEA